MKLSIIIPVFNATEELKSTLISVINGTDNLYELIVVDDHSDEKTQEFIDGLRIEDSLNCRLIKTRNPKHSWTNTSWNIGVSLASGDYIAVLNSDIRVSIHWDTHLIKLLNKYTVACPYELVKGEFVKLDPTIQKIDPKMIKGSCFMFKGKDKWLFPIPKQLVHWYGDRYLADKANKKDGVGFTKNATIIHHTTSSGRLIKPIKYLRRVLKDAIAYEKLTGKNESLIKNGLKTQIANARER